MNFLMKILQFRQFPYQFKRRQSVIFNKISTSWKPHGNTWKFPLKISFQSTKADFEMNAEMNKSVYRMAISNETFLTKFWVWFG